MTDYNNICYGGNVFVGVQRIINYGGNISQ